MKIVSYDYFFFCFSLIYSIIKVVMKMEYQTEEELFNSLKGAFNVKLRLIKDNYDYIKSVDIWNYLKISKWRKAKNLGIAEMTNDIINVDIEKVDLFLKGRIKSEDRQLEVE